MDFKNVFLRIFYILRTCYYILFHPPLSTVMGQVDKEPLRLVIILASRSIDANYECSRRIKLIVDCLAKKFAELFLSARDDFEFRGFEIISRDCLFEDFEETYVRMRRNKPDIFLNFFLGKFSRISSSNRQFLNCFVIPFDFANKLPVNMNNRGDWSEDTCRVTNSLMDHLLHEMCHSLGGFHSGEGIMRAEFNLLPEENIEIENMKLSNLIDKKTQAIICESMSIITTFPPQRDLSLVDGVLTYTTDQSIAIAYFLQDGAYTEMFEEFTFLDACKQYNVTVPDQYEAFVVVHFCGHIHYYSKKDVETTKLCTRVTTF